MNPSRKRPILTVLALIAFTLLTQLRGQEAKELPINFDFLLVATAADSDMDMWRRTLRGTALVIPTTSHLYKDQPFTVTLIFQGYSLNPKGQANVTYDFSIYGPEGELVLKDENLEGVTGANYDPDVLAMAKQLISLRFEAEDPFGEYTIEATARDGVSGNLKKRNTKVRLVPIGFAKNPESLEEFRRWLPTYYLQPDPARALLAYLNYSELENPVSGQLDYTQIAFFRYLFSENPYLLKALADSYPGADFKARLRVLFMLALLDYRDADYLADLPENERAFFENMRLLYPPDSYDELSSSQQLDMLWGEFYASGRFQPIEQVVQGLELAPYEGALAEYGSGEIAEKSEEERLNAFREVLFQAVRWSLLSNCRQHPLVRAYCGYIFQEGQLPEPIYNELGSILISADSSPSRIGFQKGIPEKPIPNPFRRPVFPPAN